MKAIPLVHPVCHLGECPLWNPEEKILYWTDILKGKIWRYIPGHQEAELYWEGDHKVGGIAFSRDGGMILCSDKGVYKIPAEEREKHNAIPKKIIDLRLTANERFNDITTDPRGRLYAGTKCNNNKNGKLFLIEKGMPPHILLEGLGISNGMTFSIDLKYFYHTDSSALTITRYHYDIHTGNISQPEIFYRGEEKNGYPDGITIDTEDHLWVAFWGASSVRRFNPHGKCVHELKIPARQPSSVMFGGEKLNELFITSACEGGDDIEKGLDAEGNFLGGITYKVITPYQGRPEWPADL